jgi:hypothetical protein
MSRRFGLAVPVETDVAGLPIALTWRDHTYHVTVIGHWRLRDHWWDAEKHSDRLYYRV